MRQSAISGAAPRLSWAAYGLRAGTLQWALGCFCALVGALMLVVPHQFSSPAFTVVRPYLPWAGTLFLVAGMALLGVAALAPRRRYAFAAHLAAGVALMLYAALLLRAGTLTGGPPYLILGLSCAAAGLLPSAGRRRRHWQSGGDLFALTLAVVAVVNGAVMLAIPAQFQLPIYDLVRPHLAVMGALFVLSGIALAWAQLLPGRPGWLTWPAHLAVAAAFLAYMALVSVPGRGITGLLLYGGFGLAIGLLPWLGSALGRLDPASLRLRLALVFVAAAALPLTLTVALITEQEERLVREQTLEGLVLIASTVARDTGDHLMLHQAVVGSFAAQPELAALPPDEQARRLASFTAAYPSFFACQINAPDGRGTARSDSASPTDVLGVALFADVRRLGAPALEVRRSTTLGQPIIAFGAPLRDEQGRFAGMVACGLELSRVFDLIETASGTGDRTVFLVDDAGRAIAHPDAESFADLSAAPPVVALRGAQQPGSLRYWHSGTQRLAGYAPLPQLGWGVVVERSAASALQSVRLGRELAFALLLLIVAGALGLGTLLARWLIQPLTTLSHAVDRFASGDADAPLPQERITEIARLSEAFGRMRDRLLAGAVAREQALGALREREEEQHFLAELGPQLAASLDYPATLATLPDLLVPRMADCCLLDVIDDDGSLRRAGGASSDPDLAPLVDQLRRWRPSASGDTPIATTLRSGLPLLLSDTDEGPLLRGVTDPDELELLRALAPRSLMLVPIIARGQTLGVLTLAMCRSRRRYGGRDLDLAVEIARRAALAFDNARLYQDAQAAVRLREEFLSIASHELKTPLTSLAGYAELLDRRAQRDERFSPRDRRGLQVIREQADRLRRLVASLLDLSRLQSGQLTIERTPVDLVALARSTVAGLQPSLDRHTLTLVAPEQPLVVVGDAVRLDQVLHNLISNALKYSPAGGPVVVVIEVQGDRAAVSVSDEGIGIPEAALPKLFERFYRAANVADQTISGLGVGLFVVHEITSLHGGEVRVRSREGAGSTFTVLLPLARREAGARTLDARPVSVQETAP